MNSTTYRRFKTGTRRLEGETRTVEEVATQYKALRESKGLTIYAVAVRAKMSPNTVRSIERGGPYHRTSLQQYLTALEANPDPLPGARSVLQSEDLDVAVKYHHAPTWLRTCIAELLSAGDYALLRPRVDPALFSLAHELSHLDAEIVDGFRQLAAHLRQTAASPTNGTVGRRRRTRPDSQPQT